jgi:starch synthase
MDGALDEDIQELKQDISFIALNKLAIDFSDGVIQGSETIHPEIGNYLSTLKDKPFLSYQTQDVYIDSFNRFYDLILDSKTA